MYIVSFKNSIASYSYYYYADFISIPRCSIIRLTINIIQGFEPLMEFVSNNHVYEKFSQIQSQAHTKTCTQTHTHTGSSIQKYKCTIKLTVRNTALLLRFCDWVASRQGGVPVLKWYRETASISQTWRKRINTHSLQFSKDKSTVMLSRIYTRTIIHTYSCTWKHVYGDTIACYHLLIVSDGEKEI